MFSTRNQETEENNECRFTDSIRCHGGRAHTTTTDYYTYDSLEKALYLTAGAAACGAYNMVSECG